MTTVVDGKIRDKEEKEEEKKKLPLGVVRAEGIKTIQVKAKDAISVRGQITAEMHNNRDVYFPDRYFCEKYLITNQQVNQIMRGLLNEGVIERVRPLVPDPYGQLPDGRRIMNRWK